MSKNKEYQQEALTRAITGQSLSNYPAIFKGFMEKGIPEDQIKPRENCFSYAAWQALGPQPRDISRGGIGGLRTPEGVRRGRKQDLQPCRLSSR